LAEFVEGVDVEVGLSVARARVGGQLVLGQQAVERRSGETELGDRIANSGRGSSTDERSSADETQMRHGRERR
jgi:hypothetical protein